MKFFANLSKILFLVSFSSSIISIICLIIWWYNFKKNCEDYLKLAADAPTVERADMFLGKALEFLEEKELTSGNSAFIFPTPTSDVGIWYEQLKAAKETIENLLKRSQENTNSVSQLERDNALMKIREVLLDGKGEVTIPPYITLYPHQWWVLIWIIFSVIGMAFFSISWIVLSETSRI